MLNEFCTFPSYLTLATSSFLGVSAALMYRFANKNNRMEEFKEAASKLWFGLFSTGLAIGSLIGFYYEQSLNNNDPKNIRNMETIFTCLGMVAIASNMALVTSLYSEGLRLILDMFKSKNSKDTDSNSSSMDTYSLDSSRSV